MLDLHMHTRYSDGSDDVSMVLEKAEKLKLKCIAITDHNTCLEYNELKDEKIRSLFSGKIIPGVELNTKVLGIPIEILGYNVDTDLLQKYIDETYMSNEERCKLEVERLYNKCISEGILLPEDFVEKYDGSMYASKYLHSLITKDENNKKLIDEDSWKDSNIFYRRYMSVPTSKFFVDMDDILPSFEKTSEIVKKSGGMVFIPHIFEYGENSIKILNYILDNYKFDGIECYYRNFTQEKTDFLLDICKKHNLYKSGGSDYHGKNKPGVEIGTGEGNLNVPDDIITWAKIFV